MAIQLEELPQEGGKRSGAINVRLTLREAQMLKVIGLATPRSQHQFILDAILGPIEEEYNRIVAANK